MSRSIRRGRGASPRRPRPPRARRAAAAGSGTGIAAGVDEQVPDPPARLARPGRGTRRTSATAPAAVPRPSTRRLRAQTAAAPPNSPMSRPAQQIQKIGRPTAPSKFTGIGLGMSSNGSDRCDAKGRSRTTPPAAATVSRHRCRQRALGSRPSGYRYASASGQRNSTGHSLERTPIHQPGVDSGCWNRMSCSAASAHMTTPTEARRARGTRDPGPGGGRPRTRRRRRARDRREEEREGQHHPRLPEPAGVPDQGHDARPGDRRDGGHGDGERREPAHVPSVVDRGPLRYRAVPELLSRAVRRCARRAPAPRRRWSTAGRPGSRRCWRR